MENQKNNSKGLSIVLIVVITFLITALVVGGGVYWWQSLKLKSEKDKNRKTIQELQNQISSL